MSDYTKATDFAAKDALLTGNPAKLVKGTELDTEFNNIATAVATKYDSADLGVTLQQYDADLAAIAALAKTDGNVIVGDGSTWVAESGATARTSLGAAATGANTFTGLQQLDYSSDIASAATVDLGTATGNSVTVTHSSGTTAITSFGGAATVQKGGIVAVIPSISGGTLTITHHATNMILLGGANITLASGDVLLMMKNHDSNAEWKHVGGWKADGTAWVAASSSSFPAGTLMLFQQTAAPTGWTKETTHNDKALRVVSGTASSGGSSAFSTVFGKTGTDAHTLTTAEMPAHTHTLLAPTTAGGTVQTTLIDGTASAVVGAGLGIASSATVTLGAKWQANSAGSGGSHSHTMNIQVQYVDLIIASKDA